MFFKHALALVALHINNWSGGPIVIIAAVAKVSCKHGLWLVARVKKQFALMELFS